MGHVFEPSPLIQTKLYRPQIHTDLVERTSLMELLDSQHNRLFLLVSAPAGFGKTTLVSQWLDRGSGTAACPAAWLSLDDNDNNLIVFLNYFIAAIQTLFPKGCSTSQNLLAAPHTPSPDYLTSTLINEITDLSKEFLLILDDYHLLTNRDIHDFVSMLLQHAPPSLHLVIISRQDLPFSVSRLRATQRMTEVRLANLRFTHAEIQTYLKLSLGVEVSPETVSVLVKRTEGWAVGLRLACLALRAQDDRADFIETFHGTHRYIMEYLIDEVLSHQPQRIQTFLLSTAILDRFCAPLCDALLETIPRSDDHEQPASREILAQLARDNLFIVSLDHHGEWFRYHHLFKELLWHKLKAETSPAQQAALQTAAGAWLDQNDFAEEALRHYFAVNDTAAAARLVARQRYALLNQTQWPLLEQRLHQFSPDILDQYPNLLMLKTWLLYHRSKYPELPAALQQLETALDQSTLTSEEINYLQGEISTLHSLLYILAVDPKSAVAHARRAVEQTRRELWIVRILARLCLALGLQMMGDTNQAYAAIYGGFEEEEIQSNHFKASLVVTVCFVHWMVTDLQEMAQAAKQSIKLSQEAGSPYILNWGHFYLGLAYYQQNDLTAAERHFAAVVQQPYLAYGDCYSYSACGLALTHQVRGQPNEARMVLESATAFFLETGNTILMALIQAFQAEISLQQGQVVAASQWAAYLDPIPPFTMIYGFFWPHLTLVKIWLAQDTPAARQQAADLLEKAKEFVETTHNTRFLIEALALQALLNETQGQSRTAVELLDQALALAQPGGFIRLFVDLGPPLARLLARINSQHSGRQKYIRRLLDAFEQEQPQLTLPASDNNAYPLIEPLTHREMDVLELLAQRLSNQEIADHLYISSVTVKRHASNIFGKLGVRNRRQAVIRAHELGLLSHK
ncbi:MAG: hypothetical protein KDI79_15670 [Anaerolineae bacterium]|nr:hypothetical protein [Anaerolineae bacterium]